MRQSRQSEVDRLASLKSRSKKPNANETEFDSLIAEAEAIFADPDAILAGAGVRENELALA